MTNKVDDPKLTSIQRTRVDVTVRPAHGSVLMRFDHLLDLHSRLVAFASRQRNLLLDVGLKVGNGSVEHGVNALGPLLAPALLR